MRRLATLLLLLTIAMTACIPEVRLLTSEPRPTAEEIDSTATPRPKTPTARPSPTQGLGAEIGDLNGVTLHLWHGLPDTQSLPLMKLAAEFSKANEWGISVQVRGSGNFSQLAEAFRNGDAGSGVPDLLLALPEQELAWDKQGLIAELNPYLSHPQFGFSAEDVKDFPAAFWEQDELDGRRLGLPALRSARLLFYNQTWARELGFEAPPQNAQEFRKQACAANATWKADADLTNDGYGGWVVDGDPWTVYAWVRAFDAQVFDGAAYTFASPESEQALVFLKELRDDGCAWLSTELSPFEHLAGRKALFVTGNMAEFGAQEAAFRAAGSTDAWTALAFPGEKQVLPTYGPSFVVLKSTPERQLASWLFARWMLAPEAQARWAGESSYLPVRTAALSLVKPPSLQWRAAGQALAFAAGFPRQADWGRVRYVLGDGFYSLFFLNLPPSKAADVLAEMDATAAELLGP